MSFPELWFQVAPDESMEQVICNHGHQPERVYRVPAVLVHMIRLPVCYKFVKSIVFYRPALAGASSSNLFHNLVFLLCSNPFKLPNRVNAITNTPRTMPCVFFCGFILPSRIPRIFVSTPYFSAYFSRRLRIVYSSLSLIFFRYMSEILSIFFSFSLYFLTHFLTHFLTLSSHPLGM